MQETVPPRVGVELPNLFVLGAGKCGTTTLHQLLALHPLIHMSAVKEPSFFCSYFQVVKDPISYFALFGTRRTVKYRGESSHVYLSNPETAPVLRGLFPDAKFILIFRQPGHRAYSLYQHMRRHGAESEASFLGALLAEAEREKWDYSAFPHYPWNLLYVGSSRFDVQIARYLDLFPRTSFLFMTLADMVRRPEMTLRKVCDFLGVPGARQFAFSASNVAPPYPPMNADAAAFLDQALAGVTDRVDEIVGEKLDWSL